MRVGRGAVTGLSSAVTIYLGSCHTLGLALMMMDVASCYLNTHYSKCLHSFDSDAVMNIKKESIKKHLPVQV